MACDATSLGLASWEAIEARGVEATRASCKDARLVNSSLKVAHLAIQVGKVVFGAEDFAFHRAQRVSAVLVAELRVTEHRLR